MMHTLIGVSESTDVVALSRDDAAIFKINPSSNAACVRA